MLGIDVHAAGRFFSELRRRKVFRVAAGYAIVGWLIIQVAASTFPALHLPAWAMTLVVVLTILGFPIALVLAWSLEFKTDGIKPETESHAIPPIGSGLGEAVRAGRRSFTTAARARAKTGSTVQAVLEEAHAGDPNQVRRAAIAGLRHDLRTPMNAILGYSDVLLSEADELGITAFVTDVQRLHSAAKRLLDDIDRLLPTGADAGTLDAQTVRRTLHDSLLQPATELVDQARRLFAEADVPDAAKADRERLLSAAMKLVEVIRELPASAAAGDKRAGGGFEQVFNRLRPDARAAEEMRAGSLLVVDDNPLNLQLLTRQLVRDGYSVLTAASGSEALEKLRMHNVDLMLLDVMMPEMDGIQVLERVQSDPSLCEIPTVMISALDEIDAVARCISKGAVDYIAKPFDPVLMRARLSSTLEIRRLREDIKHGEQELAQRQALVEQLARSLAPAPLSDSLQRRENVVPAYYPEVTAVVARLEGLHAIAARRGAGEMMARVGAAIDIFERLGRARGLPLVRAADHSYTAIAGAPEWREDHARLAAEYALELVEALHENGNDPDRPDIRLGLHTGPVVTGIAGTDKLVFVLWGEAVSTADALACQAPRGKIRVSAATAAQLRQSFELGAAEVIEVAGEGQMRTYLLASRSGSIAS
jgi:adenylate cyclase